MITENTEEKILHALYANIKDYTLLHLEAIRLEGTKKLAQILSSLIFILICLHLFTALLIFLTFQFAFFLASLFNNLPIAILAVIGFYILLFWLFFANRKCFLYKPIQKRLIKILVYHSDTNVNVPFKSAEEQQKELQHQILEQEASLRSIFNKILAPLRPTSTLDALITALNCSSSLIKGIQKGYNFIKNR